MQLQISNHIHDLLSHHYMISLKETLETKLDNI